MHNGVLQKRSLKSFVTNVFQDQQKLAFKLA